MPALLKTVPAQTLTELQQLDTCTASNAIEQFHVRTRNEGFVNGSVRCILPRLTPRVGYAVTARIRTSSTPIGSQCYFDRMDWWSYVTTIPAPRFVVAEDVDHTPGLGAFFGEIHANISKALGCVAYLTNGAVRDLPALEAADMQAFAGNIAVSHAYAHVIEFGELVEIGGLQIRPGDLLHGDQHGVHSIPVSIAEKIPMVATKLLEAEKELIDFCRSENFSFQGLAEKITSTSNKIDTAPKDPK
jgi:4-hydroxy-4-methyl-2-oxoglutarate aldolase